MARRRQQRGEKGQTATEYMLVLSVLVIASVGATSFLMSDDGPWAEGFRNFNSRMNTQIDRGYICNGEAACRGG